MIRELYSEGKVTAENIFRALIITPIPLAILPLMYSRWNGHLRVLSMTTPQNLVSLTLMILQWSITISFTDRDQRFGVKSIKLVLSTFRDKLFALTHAYTFVISTLILSTNRSRSSPVQNKFVSLANKIGINSFETGGKSLIKIKSNSGPKTDPCGTPHWIFFTLRLAIVIHYILISVAEVAGEPI